VPLFQDDILKEFGQGITDIESRRAHKKPESLVAPDIVSERKSSDWLGESFASGVEEIERSRTKRLHFSRHLVGLPLPYLHILPALALV
jgi:hypothetical protein